MYHPDDVDDVLYLSPIIVVVDVVIEYPFPSHASLYSTRTPSNGDELSFSALDSSFISFVTLILLLDSTRSILASHCPTRVSLPLM